MDQKDYITSYIQYFTFIVADSGVSVTCFSYLTVRPGFFFTAGNCSV